MPDDKVVCSFCGRGQGDTLYMVKNNDVYICRECVIRGVDLLTNNKPKPPSIKKTYLATDLTRKCSFCSRRVIDVRAVAPFKDSKDRICDECLMICFDIILRWLFGERRVSNHTLYSLVY